MGCLAESLAVGELPDLTRNGIIIRDGVGGEVPERLGYRCAQLRVVAHHGDLSSVDVLVQRAVQVDLNVDVRWEVELRVQGAGAMAGCDARRGAELVDIGGAGGWAVQACLDAVAVVPDLREGEVNFGNNTGDIEASDIANTAVAADFVETVLADAGLVVIVADCEWAGDGSSEEHSAGGDGREKHFDLILEVLVGGFE